MLQIYSKIMYVYVYACIYHENQFQLIVIIIIRQKY